MYERNYLEIAIMMTL